MSSEKVLLPPKMRGLDMISKVFSTDMMDHRLLLT